MTMLTDDEQKKLLEEEAGPITDKIDRRVSIALKQREARLKQLEQKIAEHDGFIAGFKDAWNRGIGAVTKAVKG
jgi:hypothetical protein